MKREYAGDTPGEKGGIDSSEMYDYIQADDDDELDRAGNGVASVA